MPELSGRQRAAVVLAQLDPDRAAALLGKMAETDAVALTAEVARLPVLDQATVAEVVDRLSLRLDEVAVNRGGEEVAMAHLTARFGAARAKEIMQEMRSEGEPRPFSFLGAVEAERLAKFLQTEHPQLVAVVLSKLRPEQGGKVLDHLPPETRVDVTRRIAVLRALSSEAQDRIQAELEARLLAVARARTSALVTDGIESIVEVLMEVKQPISREVIESLGEDEPELAQEIRSRMFTFEDLAAVEGRNLQEVLRRTTPETLALALKGKSARLVERFAEQLTERRAEQLEEDLALLPPQHVRDVQQAEAELVRLALALDEEEVIALNVSNEPMLE